MFWVQISLSFAIWILCGVILARRPNPGPVLSARFSRSARVMLAAGLMLGCLALLFLPLNFIASKGGLNGGAMSPLVWIVVSASGGVFVLANAVSMAILVTVAREAAVTERSYSSSTNQDPEP